ncbi:glycoside hydrolase family 5 protein [Xylariaceae sp. FL1651]|nr:glycoside hydrolase family 5 protein [Xylariaceae sp. FL1651]
MKAFLLSLGALALSSVSASPVNSVQQSAKSWMGTNLYYLQGLSDSDQNTYINDIANYGVKVVRVWANSQAGGGACEKGSKIEKAVPAFETTKGIKVVISPYDGNSLIGDYRKDVYYNTWGTSGFYSNGDARNAYKNRIKAMVNYKGKYSGKVWKDWTDAILAFDLQNEPMCADTSLCTNNDKAGWLCDIALAMRVALGGQNPIKIASGGVGGDESHGCTTIGAATGCGQIDVIAAHKYAGNEASNPDQWSNNAAAWLSKANGKLVFVEEWGVDAAAAYQPDEFKAQAADINSFGIPNLYWQFLPPQNSACPYDPKTDSGDHFGIFVGGAADIASVVSQTNNANAKQDWSAIIP